TGVVAGRASGAQLERKARHHPVIGRLDDTDEVELAERRPLLANAHTELLDLAVDLTDALRVVPERAHPLGCERREHQIGRHRGRLSARSARPADRAAPATSALTAASKRAPRT